MILKQYRPHDALQDFISRIIVFRYELDHTKPRPTNPFPPQPEHTLYFYPHDKIICRNYATQSTEELPQSVLIGPQLSRVDISMGYNMLTIIVGFRPGGLYRLLRIPMQEMLDQAFDTSLFLGKEIDNITQQLNEAADFNQMNAVIQRYLLSKVKLLKAALPIDTVLTQMLHNKTQINVDELGLHACVSIRQLERQFKERIGMPPKTFLRLIRFSNAWCMREKNPAMSWFNIAHTCNYADQMHMIRDFKDFAGVTPGILQNDLKKSPLVLQGITLA